MPCWDFESFETSKFEARRIREFFGNFRVESHCRKATFSTINRQPQVRKSTCTRRGAAASRWNEWLSSTRRQRNDVRCRGGVPIPRVVSQGRNTADVTEYCSPEFSPRCIISRCLFRTVSLLSTAAILLFPDISKLSGGSSRAFYVVYLAGCLIEMLSINEHERRKNLYIYTLLALNANKYLRIRKINVQ